MREQPAVLSPSLTIRDRPITQRQLFHLLQGYVGTAVVGLRDCSPLGHNTFKSPHTVALTSRSLALPSAVCPTGCRLG